MSAISSEVDRGGIVTATRPWDEPAKGWNSSIKNQIRPAASASASSDTTRPIHEFRRRPAPGNRRRLDLGGFGGAGFSRTLTRRGPHGGAGFWPPGADPSSPPPRPAPS